MNKKTTISIIGSVAIIIIVLFAIGTRDNTESNSTNTKTNTPSNFEPNQVTIPVNTKPQASPGQYVDYDEQKFTATTGTRVLFFHASWCPQCRSLESSIKSSQLPENTSIFKVDFDNSSDLKQKYGVTLQTTVVLVDASGNLVKKFVAYDTPNFDAVKSNLL